MITLAQAVKRLMIKEGIEYVSRDNRALLDEAYLLSGAKNITVRYSLDKYKSIIKVISNSDLFKREGIVILDIRQGLEDRYYPNYKLK